MARSDKYESALSELRSWDNSALRTEIGKNRVNVAETNAASTLVGVLISVILAVYSLQSSSPIAIALIIYGLLFVGLSVAMLMTLTNFNRRIEVASQVLAEREESPMEQP